MQRVNPGRKLEAAVVEIMEGFEQGEDPRAAIARLNKRIVAYQSAGENVPARLLRLSQVLANECVAQSQGR